MPKTEEEWFGRRFAPRLRAELDRVRPLDSPPRYLVARPRVAVWRLAPAMLAVAFTGILALGAWAETGTPGPSVWTQRVETVLNPPTPTAETTPAPAPPVHQDADRPTQEPEDGQSNEPRETPEPAGHNSDDGDTSDH